MMAYFVLGGGYSLKENAHVRMDLFYERISKRGRNLMDAWVMAFLIVYLILLLWGGIESTIYAIEYKERSYSSWQPYMAPIKIILNIGIFLTLLQAMAIWLKDIISIKDGSNKINNRKLISTHFAYSRKWEDQQQRRKITDWQLNRYFEII